MAMMKTFRAVAAAALLTVAAVAVSADHPDTYTVKRGDTLWDISARFLKKPLAWTLLVVVDPQPDALVVHASTTCDSTDILAPGSFSWHVLSSLTDEVTTFSDGSAAADGEVFGISMTTRRASSLQ